MQNLRMTSIWQIVYFQSTIFDFQDFLFIIIEYFFY